LSAYNPTADADVKNKANALAFITATKGLTYTDFTSKTVTTDAYPHDLLRWCNAALYIHSIYGCNDFGAGRFEEVEQYVCVDAC
jgi:hypothetical protein